MNFLKINKPDVTLINLCIELANDINKFDKMSNPIFSIDDFTSMDNLPILYYAMKDNELAGFIGISLIDNTEIELCGFVLPKYRNLKIASHLLEMIFDDYEDFQIKVPIEPSNTLGKFFLNSYNATYENTECIMELKKDSYCFITDEIKLSSISKENLITYKAYDSNIEIGKANIYIENISTLDNQPFFSSDHTFIIHDVEIYPEYRGMKYGLRLLHSLLSKQFNSHTKATLHVTKENVPAFNLYHKLGFSISKQIEYYSL